MFRKTLVTLIVLAAASTALAADAPAVAPEWVTKAEATSFRETPTYDETLEYIRRVEKANPRRVKLDFFGKSAEGRPIPYVVVDRDGHFTAAEAQKGERAVVFIQSGIHAGEIDGKDASLMLLRELAATHKLSFLLTHVTIVFLPIYNVDGHERRSPYNRINQNGPKEMGFRTNANGLDLNRDYLKIDSPEARAFVRLFDEWRPDLFVDCHVTDGADFRYELTWAWQPQPAMPEPVGRLLDALLPRARGLYEAKGHEVAPYIMLRDEADPVRGMDGGAAPPRFSTGYTPLRNRPGLLLESHVYKDYAARVRATYDMLVALLQVVDDQAQALRQVVRSTDATKVAWGEKYDPNRKVVLRWGISPDPERFVFKTWKSTVVNSELTGGKFTIYSRDPLDLVIPYYSTPVPEKTVVRPRGYLVPASRRDVAERLRAHGLAVVELDRPVEGEFEMYRVSDAKFQEKPYQGRHPVTATIAPVRENRSFPAGSFWVPMAQPDADVAIQLLEPEGPDSLFSWGFFDSIVERKEYYETAVLEKLALKEMQEHREIIEELGKLRDKDPALRTPEGVREWFYKRSPWWDREVGLYPVARVTTQEIPLPAPKSAAPATAK